MSTYDFFVYLNDSILSLPSLLLFLGTAIIISIKTGFVQIRGFPQFISCIVHGIRDNAALKSETNTIQTVSSFHALFTAMGTTLGMGNVVGPSVAIMLGGPGALFWLLVYMFFASAVKYTEVVLALKTRRTLAHGYVIGGPMVYLQEVYPAFGLFYAAVMSVLLTGWSGLQANTMAQICALESIPVYIPGILLALITVTVISGGVERISTVATKLVPLMFFLYLFFALIIIIQNPTAFYNALSLIKDNIFSPAAPAGAFGGASILQAMRHGVYRGIFITEAGVGTSSIPHSLARTHDPINQGILAACSTIADALLSIVSGIIVLITGVWKSGLLRSTLIYESFKGYAPFSGDIILFISITLLVVTTVIGNSFNGMQSFSFLTNHRWLRFYILASALTTFVCSLVSMAIIWQIMDSVLACAAGVNIVGILILVFSKKNKLLGT